MTDGKFTTCSGGAQEWSDVPAHAFTETNAFLYADQANLVAGQGIPGSPVDTFMLMYDECGRTTPLGKDEYFLISFDTVEVEDGKEHLERYNVHIFSDGTIVYFENDELQTVGGKARVTEIYGQRGHAGFGPSPSCAFDHLVVEYQIILDAAGGQSYSPDPIFWGGTNPSCTVTISGASSTMNVGEQAKLTASVSGGGTPVAYQWSIEGPVIKDYKESWKAPWSTTPLTAADLQSGSGQLDFYWKPLANQVHPANAGPQPRKVTVTAQAGSETCTDTKTVMVERNNTTTAKQAEFFYTTNHSRIVPVEHEEWHLRFPFRTNHGGVRFFDFHREFLGRFDSWRAEFGYPPLVPYQGVGPLPTGVDIDHANRASNTVNNPKPSWLTGAGGAVGRPPISLPCDNGQPSGQLKLGDFPADQNHLACATEIQWHNSTHGQIGGDMNSFSGAPRDPIFWRWHTAVEAVSAERKTLTPPIIEYQMPVDFGEFIPSLPSVSVRFSEPVTGVVAADLTVNGSPATAVTGTGAGLYEFTGFAAPGLGTATVTVRAGAIRDGDGEQFAGRTWQYTVMDPNADSDGDGILNGAEAQTHYTDPTKADTDDDGLPDGFEIANTCLNPRFDQAHPHGHGPGEDPEPGDDDADDDGITDTEEFLAGTNPCRRSFVPGDPTTLDNKGKEFILAYLRNAGSATIELHVTSDVTTDVTVNYPVDSPTFTTTVAVPANEVTIVSLPQSASTAWTTNVPANNAVLATAPSEFVAYMVNRASATSDAALALPVDTFNTQYIVTDYTPAFGPSSFNVYGAFDNTKVTITPSNALNGHPAGVPFDVTLDSGEGVQFESAASSGLPGSLTGTIVSADKPVGMTNGSRCVQVPLGTTACDHVFEVAQPVQTWGRDVLVLNLPQRAGGTVYRILASEDGTAIRQDGALIGTLDRGRFLETLPLPGNHEFSADKPIFVTQFMTGVSAPGSVSGDPAMSNMIPFEQYLDHYTFSTVGGAQFATNYVSLIVQNADVGTAQLDGVAVPASAFSAIGSTGFSGAVLPLSSGVHTTFTDGVHGITVEGLNNADSYVYPGGARFQFINPTGDANAPVVTLLPEPGNPKAVQGSARDDRPSEDVNQNATLDAGEDLNGNGKIDADTGIFFVELVPGSTNLSLMVASFVPGEGTVDFQLELVDASAPGTGSVRVTDGAGNETLTDVTLPFGGAGDGDGIPDDIDNCPGTANPDQADANLNGIGDACERPGLRHSTAGFLQALLDGTTTVQRTDTLVSSEPSIKERLERIVEFRMRAGLATSRSTLVANLVGSLVEAGLVAPGEADALINSLAPTGTTTALTSSPNPSAVGEAVTLTATVSSSGGTVAGGTVQFRDGPANLGPPVAVTAGKASLTTSTLGAGNHAITAIYSGSVTFAASTSPLLEQVVTASFTCDQTISGRVGPQTLGPGRWCIQGATVPALTVQPGAAVSITASQIAGPVTVTGATLFRVCGSAISRGLTVSGSSGLVVLGHASAGCARNDIQGDLVVRGNTGGVTIADDRISGNLAVDSNVAAGSAGLIVSANTVVGALGCTANTPAPVNGGVVNVAATKTGQCAAM